MKQTLYIAKISIVILFALITSGCYTIINPPEDYSNYQTNDSYSKSDTLNVDGNYTIINNYDSNDQESCCNYGDCHDWPCSGHYHGHHQGHHYGHYHGYGYFYHSHHHHYYDNGYHYGFHDGYWWGYEDGYDDGWNDNEDYDNDYDDSNNDYGNSSNNTIERRENSYNSEQEDTEIAQEDNNEQIDEETNDSSSNDIISIEKDLIIEPSIPNENSDNNVNSPNERKYNVNNNSSSATNYESILIEDKKAKYKTRKRNSAAFDIAKIIITSISNSKKSKNDKSSISKSKNKKKDKSSTKKKDKSPSNSKKSSKKSSNLKVRR